MSDDLISREALLKAMEEERQYLLARGQTGAEHILVHHCLPLIDNAPTVERPKGKWEDDKVALYLTCSECGCSVRCAEHVFLDDDNGYYYCSNCGAKMEGGAE